MLGSTLQQLPCMLSDSMEGMGSEAACMLICADGCTCMALFMGSGQHDQCT